MSDCFNYYKNLVGISNFHYYCSPNIKKCQVTQGLTSVETNKTQI